MSPSRVPGLRLTPKGWAALEAAGYRWRRRRARPLDWSDPESPIYCPELTTPGGYVRRVSRYPKDSRFTNAETNDQVSAEIAADS